MDHNFYFIHDMVSAEVYVDIKAVNWGTSVIFFECPVIVKISVFSTSDSV